MMKETAQKIVDATMKYTLRPKSGDRQKVVATVIREVVKSLKNESGTIKEKDLLHLADEIDSVDISTDNSLYDTIEVVRIINQRLQSGEPAPTTLRELLERIEELKQNYD